MTRHLNPAVTDVSADATQVMALSLHGVGMLLENAVPSVARPLDRLLSEFRQPLLAAFPPVLGSIIPYDEADFSSSLSPDAERIHIRRNDFEPTEMFEAGDRFWAIDDRWGATSIDLADGTFRTWLLPEPRLDPLHCVESAVLWPMAQVLRTRGVYLLPAASVVRDGWAALLLGSSAGEASLRNLLDQSYRLIGQRWTALREEEDRIALLHMPGWVDRDTAPLLRIAGGTACFTSEFKGCADLTAERRNVTQRHAFCDVVMIGNTDPSAASDFVKCSDTDAFELLKSAWPIAELHPAFRDHSIAARLAGDCRVGRTDLSRNPRESAVLLQSLRATSFAARTAA